MTKEKLTPYSRGSGLPLQSLQEEYEQAQALFDLQTPIIQRFLEAQGRQLSENLLQNKPQVRFMLPDRVVSEPPGHTLSVPAEFREQSTGSVINRLTRADLRTNLREELSELEGSSRRAVALSAQLIRYATARFMVYAMLPSGRTVHYMAVEGEEVPSIPQEDPRDLQSAITEQTDAIVESGEQAPERGELQVPFVPAARRFFLPQWVPFDEHGSLLVNTIAEAENQVASMQNYLSVLHSAVSIVPYFVADPEYQKKRYGMLGQLVNQGRALAQYQTNEIIRVIKRRASAHDLNRGLSLSLPFFDDQMLQIRLRDFTVIPAGRIMFVPAFVVRASREEQAKIAQDTRLSPSTRKHMLCQLKMLEAAFIP
jgi:hypothetical protein